MKTVVNVEFYKFVETLISLVLIGLRPKTLLGAKVGSFSGQKSG